VPADTVIDASGKLVMPGGIDVHTHLDMPFGGTTSADDFESGTIAAAHGGTTTLIDFAIQSFGEGLYPAFDGWMKKAEGKAAIDYAFHMIVRELSDQASHDMDKMTRHDGHHVVQAVHGLPGRLHGGRRHHLQGAPARRATTAASSACTPRTAA
jgi:dihydroorotase-like cyclic amidohydrolase